MRPNDGAVLIPSFYRYGPNGQPVANAAGSPIMRAALPFAPEDGVADVKNLPDSPGLFHANNTFTPNDSIWMDLGFPVMIGPDGRAFKPLFASLIQDLDNRANVHGNNAQDNAVDNNLPMVPNWALSHQGWARPAR